MRSTHPSPFLLAGLVALHVACGGGDGGSGPTYPTTPPGTPAPGGGSRDAGPTDPPSRSPYLVTISDFGFSPAELVVPPGATVTVTNLDGTAHSVTSSAAPGTYVRGAASGVQFDTGEFASGDRTFVIPAETPSGTVLPYFCTVHRSMMRNQPHLRVQ